KNDYHSFLGLQEEYERRLFRRGQMSNFIDPEGQKFKGTIQGIAPTGQLQLRLEDETLKNYDFKMLRLVL
ncbi:MAG: biotin--[acetyl-CoA-carboxylase] ligase, partial [Bacteroidota bacterium]